MGLFKRILGICETKPPENGDCWKYSEGEIEVELGRVPELSDHGGAIRLEGKNMPKRVLVAYGFDERFHAFENRCTHMGRRIDPVADTEAIRCCSVSRSMFDYTGKLISGPAKGPLTSFKVESKDGKLIISIS